LNFEEKMKRISAAIIGAGARSIGFSRFIADNPGIVKLVALVDSNIEKAKFIANYYKFESEIYGSIHDALNRKDIDALLISTPDYAHVEPAIAALKANKHVYIEKPLATSVGDCDKIIAAANNSKSICYMGFNLRHNPVYETVYDIIHEGRLGTITTIEANEYYYGGKTYFRRWNRFRKFGGGLWFTKAAHDFDYITWLAGGKPVSVYATANLSYYKFKADAGPRCRDCKLKMSCPDFYDVCKPVENWFDEAWRELQLKMDQDGPMAPDICLFNSEKDTFDNGTVSIVYDNDIRATYTLSVLSSRDTRQIRVVGTEGMLEADIENSIVSQIQRHTGKRINYDLSKLTKGPHGGADERILKHFFDICLNGGKPISDLNAGKLAVQISTAATQSSDTGLVVNMNDIR
jgi:predicted dehydrogenase